MLDKLISCCVPKCNQKSVNDLICNEAFHYVEPRHRTKFINIMWSIGQAIRNCNFIEIDYTRTKDKANILASSKIAWFVGFFEINDSSYYFAILLYIPTDKHHLHGHLEPVSRKLSQPFFWIVTSLDAVNYI